MKRIFFFFSPQKGRTTLYSNLNKVNKTIVLYYIYLPIIHPTLVHHAMILRWLMSGGHWLRQISRLCVKKKKQKRKDPIFTVHCHQNLILSYLLQTKAAFFKSQVPRAMVPTLAIQFPSHSNSSLPSCFVTMLGG